jgi:hypothetical protein
LTAFGLGMAYTSLKGINVASESCGCQEENRRVRPSDKALQVSNFHAALSRPLGKRLDHYYLD